MPTSGRRTSRSARLRVGLEREAEPVAKAGAVERRGETAGVLGEPRQVVDEERRPVLARERLGVAAGDRQAAVTRRRDPVAIHHGARDERPRIARADRLHRPSAAHALGGVGVPGLRCG